MRLIRNRFALAAVIMLIAGACSSTPAGSNGPANSGGALTKVRFQLQWVAQAQFAGYYAALDQGYYKDQGLDVQLLLGGPDINPMQVVAADGADRHHMGAQDAGVARRRHGPRGHRPDLPALGTLEVSFKDKNITQGRRHEGQEGRQLAGRQ